MVDFNIHEIQRNRILEMVTEEQSVRYSKGIQELYTTQFYAAQHNPNYQSVNMEREIQKYILKKFGFTDNDTSLAEYWKIPSTYWRDDEIKNSIFYMKLNIFQYPTLEINDDLIDTHLVDYTTEQEMDLRSLQTPGRPLILLAGSMTWPPFRASMDAYQTFYDEYSSKADIYIVYILEAHFVEKDADGHIINGWPIGNQYNYEQTKTLSERRQMVQLLLDEYHPTIPILMDKMDNHFQHAYHPWPDRAYVFLDGKIKYISMTNDDGSRDVCWTDEIAALLPTLA